MQHHESLLVSSTIQEVSDVRWIQQFNPTEQSGWKVKWEKKWEKGLEMGKMEWYCEGAAKT